MLAASVASCGVMPNSTTLRKNCSRFWSWVSPPCTENTRKGLPSFSASEGVRVARGRLPGCSTLNGFSLGSNTKLCMRWLNPTPVWPAITAGVQPPLGVTDTAQPFSSVVSTLVVPSRKLRSYSARAVGLHSFDLPPSAAILLCHFCNTLTNGLVPPWNGQG